MEQRRLVPAVDLDGDQQALGDELGDDRLATCGVEPVVVGEVGDGCDAERAGSQQQQPAPGLGFGQRRRGEHVGRHDALDQVVEAGEVAAAAGGADGAGANSVSNATLASSQSHHVPRLAHTALDVADGDRAADADLLEDSLDHAGMLAA